MDDNCPEMAIVCTLNQRAPTLLHSLHSTPSLGADLLEVGELVDPRLHLRPEVADEALHGPRRGVAQGANRVPLDLTRQLLPH